MNVAYPINTAWMWANWPSLRRFESASHNVSKSQSGKLFETIDANRDTAIGKQLGFEKIHHVDDFRDRVPVSDYEQVSPWIERIIAGESNVLTTDRVRLFEPTSGTTQGRRLIPYTKSLQLEFQNGIHPWIANLFARCPACRSGKAYWAVTPSLDRSRTASGIPIGFDDDSEYLGWFGRVAARNVMALPPNFVNETTAENALMKTLCALLPQRDLTLVSVWSPTFLIRLIEDLDARRSEIAERICVSRTQHAKRAKAILDSSSSVNEMTSELWPRLCVISCWADASAAQFVPQVRSLFPRVSIQPKGLISTEAFVSFPLMNTGSSSRNVLSIRSHFFEFQSIEHSSDDTLLAHELAVGQQYKVIVTTRGGLYRYQTNDVIQVDGFYHQCPIIRFMGRANTSDLVGEKLSEAFVTQAITRTIQKIGITPRSAILTTRSDTLGYRLLVELESNNAATVSENSIADALQRFLCENPYYDHAIRSGQLTDLDSIITNVDLQKTYEQACIKSGIRQGDIKPRSLETKLDWLTEIETAKG